VIVAVTFELRGRLEPVEVPAEGLDSLELADNGQSGFILVRFGRDGCSREWGLEGSSRRRSTGMGCKWDWAL
jgi:hypothetical protein